jgi:hypothetical protein
MKCFRIPSLAAVVAPQHAAAVRSNRTALNAGEEPDTDAAIAWTTLTVLQIIKSSE